MTYDASTRAELVPAATVVRVLTPLARDRGADLLVVGAAARDALVTSRTGAAPLRATNDVDVAIAVAGWDDYGHVTATLDREPRIEHRFVVAGIQVDIVPFGGVEDADRVIRWPDDHVMTVLGFAEASASAVEVVLPGGVAARVASLPAQVVLKLVAWRDRGHLDRRDAVDVLTLLRAYGQGDYLGELFDRAPRSLDRHGNDVDLAAADRAGADAAALLRADAVDEIATLLDRELSDEGRLPAAMGTPVGRSRALLAAYRAGLLAGRAGH